MENTINTALSGLNAFSTSLSVTANNVANSISSNFKPSETVMESVAGGGVTAEVQPSGENTVNISSEMVNLLVSKNGFEANLKTLEAGEEMAKKTIDIMA